MGVVWLILKIIGLVVLAILGLIVVALFIPVVIDLGYKDKALFVRVGYLFLRFQVFPQKPKAKKQRKPKVDSAQEQTKEAARKIDFAQMKQLLAPGGKAVSFILKRIKVRRLRVVIDVSKPDVADTGITAGYLWAGLGASVSLAKGLFDVRVDEIAVRPDFDSEQDRMDVDASVRLRTLPMFAVIAGLIFVFRWIKIQNNKESEQYGERTTPRVGNG